MKQIIRIILLTICFNGFGQLFLDEHIDTIYNKLKSTSGYRKVHKEQNKLIAYNYIDNNLWAIETRYYREGYCYKVIFSHNIKDSAEVIMLANMLFTKKISDNMWVTYSEEYLRFRLYYIECKEGRINLVVESIGNRLELNLRVNK